MKNKKTMTIFIISLIIVAIVLCFVCYFSIQSKSQDDSDIQTEGTKLNITYSDEELSGAWESYVAKITLNNDMTTVEGSGVTNSNNQIKITKAGTYYITGIISDGNIVIEAGKNDDVQLVLDNCSITSLETAPINCIKCNKLTITLNDGSTNTITDTNTYTKYTDTEKTEPDGAIFSKTDLVINGKGTLIVNAKLGDGIVSKDALEIINANLKIASADDGIRGKDYITIKDASINIEAVGDGIKATNEDDETLGYIAIECGDINIVSEGDGIQAESILNISDNAKINIKTTGEISNNKNNSNQMMGKGGQGNRWATNNSDSETGVSSKGLKAGSEITIESGNITVTSTDDSIHSNGVIIINNGIFEISSGDDGIHADTNIIINNGKINISKSYEGIESGSIEINGGTISLIASDDGINVSGGNDGSGVNGRPGQNNFNSISNSSRKLVINDGTITVNSTGDGLDSNGSIYINGGTILVKGPTSSADAPVDFDGECVISSGNLIAYGASGMAELPSNSSKQNSLVFYTSGSSNATLTLKDSSGNTITTVETEKTYSMIIISSEKIKTGETYTLYQNNSFIGSITVNSVVSSNGNNFGGNNGMKGNRR